MPEFYMIFARKIAFPNLGTRTPLSPRTPTPMAVGVDFVVIFVVVRICSIHIHTYFISNTAVTRTTLCWEDSKATMALTAALKKKKKQLKKNMSARQHV